MTMPALGKSEYREIAALHAENIHAGFLSSLGISFLALLYQCIDECSASVLFLHKEDDHIVGFVSASEGLRPVYVRLFKHFPTLIWSLLPALFSFGKLRKIVELLFLKRKNQMDKTQSHKAELLSIAVDPAYRGKGIAQSLYRMLCDYYQDKGVNGFTIVVGEQLTGAHRFYLKNGAQFVDTIKIHGEANSVVYLQEVSAKP